MKTNQIKDGKTEVFASTSTPHLYRLRQDWRLLSSLAHQAFFTCGFNLRYQGKIIIYHYIVQDRPKDAKALLHSNPKGIQALGRYWRLNYCLRLFRLAFYRLGESLWSGPWSVNSQKTIVQRKNHKSCTNRTNALFPIVSSLRQLFTMQISLSKKVSRKVFYYIKIGYCLVNYYSY
jgi:hypothetical protein